MRSLGHNSVVYVDDSYLQRKTYLACLDNISDTIKLLRELGFVSNTEKSVLTSSQTTVFLGGQVDSPELPEMPEITEMMENFTKITKYITKIKERLINYVWEKSHIKKQ